MPITLSVFGQQVEATLSLADGVQTIVERTGGDDGPQATVIFKCGWFDRITLYKALLGTTLMQNGKISRLPPARYPTSPNLFCTSIPNTVGLKPRTDEDGSKTGTPGWVYYEYAIVTAVFTNPMWDATTQEDQQEQPNDPSGLFFTTTKFKTSAEVFSPPGGAYYYQSGQFANKPVDDSSVGLIRSRVEISMTRHMLPAVPLKEILTTGGFVNDQPLTFANYTFPRGCVLFLSASTDPKPDPASGETRQEVEYSFLANESVEWNELLDPSGNYVQIANKDGDPPFEYIDFAEIFADEIFEPGE